MLFLSFLDDINISWQYLAAPLVLSDNVGYIGDAKRQQRAV